MLFDAERLRGGCMVVDVVLVVNSELGAPVELDCAALDALETALPSRKALALERWVSRLAEPEAVV